MTFGSHYVGSEMTCSILPDVRKLRPEVNFKIEASKVLVILGVSDDIDLELGCRYHQPEPNNVVLGRHTTRDFLWKFNSLHDSVSTFLNRTLYICVSLAPEIEKLDF